MISPTLASEIVRLYHAERWTPGTIARQLRVHHSTVRRVLEQAGIPTPPRLRPTLIDPYVAFITQTLTQYPQLRASRLYRMVQERGYAGSVDRFRHLVSPYRPKPLAEAYLRLRSLPGAQGQVDWAHFGKLTSGGHSGR